MKKLTTNTCECCGGNSFKRINNRTIECEYCGTQYENEVYEADQRYDNVVVGNYNVIVSSNSTIKNSTISINTGTEEAEKEEKEQRKWDGLVMSHLLLILVSFGVLLWGIGLMKNGNTNGKILAFFGITMILGAIGSMHRRTEGSE